jgi:flagellar hook protein FlgE
MGSSALYSAISGLQSDSSWLDVIGNNISNSDTIGFKSSSVSFANQFNQVLSTGEGDHSAAELGGIDPLSVGTGTRLQSIQTQYTQGTTQQTGVTTDISIQGNGFLVAKSGSNTYLTRAGNLTFDSADNLVDGSGGFIQGYNASLQYTKTTINSFSSAGGPFNPPFVPAVITNAAYQLNTSDPANITNIQINPNMTMPPKATTVMNLQGNLDAFQQATTSGGVLNLNPNGKPTLPLGADLNLFLAAGVTPLNNNVATLAGIGGPVTAGTSYALQQTADFTATQAPIVDGGTNLAGIVAAQGNYAWEQQPPLPPATQISETVYDSNGIPRQVTVQFYQVNDLGPGGINSANGPSQAAYAWYAFDTTGGQQVSTANLLGGTGILEGDLANNPIPFTYSYDEGTLGQIEIGDLIYFNTDGSLASAGGGFGVPPGNIFGVPPSGGFPAAPHIYLPPYNKFEPVSPIPSQGAEIMQVTLNFGTFGVIGAGRRDGLTGDADGTYQPVSGVKTYVPDSHVMATQNGYAPGDLQNLGFNQAGTIVGSFSNGQNLDLAQVALASVNNPGGLNSSGSNYYSTSVNSGAVEMGSAGQNGLGTIEGGTLEDSNVNLTDELSNMIIAQRGFETNARMISVVSSELQTVTQLGL